jgi:hypothetical protein
MRCNFCEKKDSNMTKTLSKDWICITCYQDAWEILFKGNFSTPDVVRVNLFLDKYKEIKTRYLYLFRQLGVLTKQSPEELVNTIITIEDQFCLEKMMSLREPIVNNKLTHYQMITMLMSEYKSYIIKHYPGVNFDKVEDTIISKIINKEDEEEVKRVNYIYQLVI